MSNTGGLMPRLSDKEGRVASYLRLSITDRCNLNCLYCRDPRRKTFIPHGEILRYEEIFRLAAIFGSMGIRKLRITGGEPFMRKNCMAFLADMRRKFPDLRLCITTNGTLLEPWLDDIRAIRPQSVNISLDSFRGATFSRVTGSDLLPQVLNNIDGLLRRGVRVKLNVVAMKGITDVEMDDFIHAARQMPVDLRFIEFMPMGAATVWTPGIYLSTPALLAIAGQKARLVAMAAEPRDFSGPAKMYAIAGARGRLGFISALSDHFCGSCNRLRITSNGMLRTCLFSDKEYRLAPLLRHGKIPDATIAKVAATACLKKPSGAALLEARLGRAVASREMSGIGG